MCVWKQCNFGLQHIIMDETRYIRPPLEWHVKKWSDIYIEDIHPVYIYALLWTISGQSECWTQTALKCLLQHWEGSSVPRQVGGGSNLNFFCKKLEIIADISKSNFLQQKVNAVYVVIFATQVCIGCDFHDNSICLILALNFSESQVFDADQQQTQKKHI